MAGLNFAAKIGRCRKENALKICVKDFGQSFMFKHLINKQENFLVVSELLKETFIPVTYD